MSQKEPTGHRIADVARKLDVHPIAPDGIVPEGTMCAIARNGDVFDMADVFEAILGRIERLERVSSAGPFGGVS